MEGITVNDNVVQIDEWKLKIILGAYLEREGEKLGNDFTLKINTGPTLPRCERDNGFYVTSL